ncbi:MAG TPA: DUF61 family protein [Candidatus Methanomethylophilaceae archaeon]|nr:DUF61 family protein [Candidatus Methanomethylophilaceae archaeon]
MDDTRYIQSILGDINSNIPISRRTLSDYIQNGDLTYKTRSGEEFMMESSEIDVLADLCSNVEKIRLRLPIIVTTDISGDHGAWKVDGTVETSVMSKILGKSPFKDDILRFYNPHLADLRRKFPTIVVLAFIP